jgi:hypothetical protein
MKEYRKQEVWLHPFLSPALNGNKHSPSHRGQFTPRNRAQVDHLTGGLVGRTGEKYGKTCKVEHLRKLATFHNWPHNYGTGNFIYDMILIWPPVYVGTWPQFLYKWGTIGRSFLRHCATSQKVAGSISDGVIEIFYSLNPSGHSMILGSTQPLTEMSIWNICSWGGGRV